MTEAIQCHREGQSCTFSELFGDIIMAIFAIPSHKFKFVTSESLGLLHGSISITYIKDRSHSRKYLSFGEKIVKIGQLFSIKFA